MTNKKEMTAPYLLAQIRSSRFKNVVMILYPMFPQKSMKNF